ncbi:MAG: patatin family protein [Oscillospiraceae bacterium]|nr:patatin family protein [Oscillospiraceae bacterium]
MNNIIGKTYTHPVIKGKRYTKMMPEGTALVLEGGGTRGFYSSGVFDAFIDEGIMFPYIIGVSAGAANALSYISGQKGRSRLIVEHYVGSHKYVSRRNLLKHGTMFGLDFIFKTVPEQHIFWDKEMFDFADIRFLTGATDCAAGVPVWFEKSEITPWFEVTRASCAVPLLSKIIKIGGLNLLDGGISAPIPIEKSMKDGNTFHVIVLTRNPGYTKPPFTHKRILKLFYRKYPELINAIVNRHKVYKKQLELCEQLERDGKAVIIRPLRPLPDSAGTTGRDIPKLLELYDEGYEECKELIFDKIMGINSQ